MPQTALAPAFAWGTADATGDMTATNVTKTGTQTDAHGTTNAMLLTRTSASDSYVLKNFTPRRILAHPAYFILKAGTATQSRVSIEESATPRLNLTVAWAGGVPTVTASTGTALVPLALGGGWYMIRGITTQLTTNSNQYVIRPDNSGTSGTCYYYGCSFAVLDCPDPPTYYHEARDGSAWSRSAAGVDDAWITGTDYFATFAARWLPSQDADSPASTTGWWGLSPTAGVGIGVQSLIAAGWNRDDILYSPNRSSTAGFFHVNIVEPQSGRPSLEPNATESVTFVLKSAGLSLGADLSML